MRSFITFAFIGILANLTGCNEFVATNEPVTAIDVVGDPSDPVADSMEPADILGSAMPDPDDSETLSDLRPQDEPSIQAGESVKPLPAPARQAVINSGSLKK